MSAESNIYAIEDQVETAIAAVLTESGLTAYNSVTAAEFQKTRPRVEVVLILGQGDGQWFTVNNQVRETCWSANLIVSLVTDSKIDVHSALRTTVRALMAGICDLVNQAHLPYHRIQNFIMDAGTSPLYEPETGVYKTDMSFNLHVSVQNDAWAALPAS